MKERALKLLKNKKFLIALSVLLVIIIQEVSILLGYDTRLLVEAIKTIFSAFVAVLDATGGLL